MPALALLLSIGAVIYYQVVITVYAGTRIVHTYMYAELSSLLSWLAVILGFEWLLLLQCNHKWVVAEPGKRFNWCALLVQSVMIVEAWLSLQMARLSEWLIMTRGVMNPSWTMLGAMFVMGLGFSALVESRRATIPADELREPAPPSDLPLPGEPFTYVESEFDSWAIAFGLLLTALYLIPGLFGSNHLPSAVGLLVGGLLISLGRRKVSVSPEMIVVSCGIIRQRIRVGEIAACRAVHYPCMSIWSLKHPIPLCNTTGRCIEITTRKGKRHVFGMLRPTYAVMLLEPIISAQGAQAGDQTAGCGSHEVV